MDFIDLHHLSRWYGSHQALKDVSLHLDRGRIGLLGPNGAGKSTLLKILLGLLPPSAGSGSVLGHDLQAAEETPGSLGWQAGWGWNAFTPDIVALSQPF